MENINNVSTYSSGVAASVPSTARGSGFDQTSLYREESLPLITWNNDTESFEVNQDVVAMLSSLKGPIGVIAVAGQYRTGKSYLLNRMLLNRQVGGFGVGPSINPCTKGLWIWGTPISGFTTDGQPINVLVVDSEGIGGLDEDNNHDMRIFSLALLLSSYFLYNSTGSIDENALSSLSLVVNITKHIQFKSQGGEDSIDELVDYLPSFMWVVRDFALQLVDEEGNEMTSKEYLERALQERGSDLKNEIRLHLKKFFKERECCTMIRPLTNEEELQNLEKMDLDELRAEFVEQVMLLRRKVINKIKPKAINGQVLDGSMWIQLVEQYVKAINEGVVPNIQSSWIYICKQNAQKAVDQMKARFEHELSEYVNLPMNQEDLDSFLKQQNTSLTGNLFKLIKGDQEAVQEYITEFQEFFAQKSQELVQANQLECRRYATDLIGQLFQELDQSLKATAKEGQVYDMTHLDLTLKDLAVIYDQNALDFAEKTYLLAEAKASFLQDLIHQQAKHQESEKEHQRQLDLQNKERLELALREAKEEASSLKIKNEERLRQVMMERSEIEAHNQFLREQVDHLKTSKEQDEVDLKRQIQELRSKVSDAEDSMRVNKDEYEEELQTIQRQMLQSDSEFDKERALFEQKVEFLERALQEKSDRERTYLSEIQSKKSEMSTELRTMVQKYETDIKSLQIQLEEEREKFTEIESSLRQQVEALESNEAQFLSTEQTLKSQLQSAQEHSRQMEATLNILKRETDLKMNSQSKEKDSRVEQYSQQIQDLEQQLRDVSEQAKLRENDYKKERAVKDQKIEFLDMQLTDCKAQLEDAYRQHEQMVKAMKSDNSMLADDSSSDGEKVELFQQELERVRAENTLLQYEIKHHTETYQERVNELELQLKLSQSDYTQSQREINSSISDLEAQRSQLMDKIKVLEHARIKVVEEADRKNKELIQQCEEEIEMKTQAAQDELKQMQERSEESLAQLRNFYEMEKEKMEMRLQEERERGQRRMGQWQEELEQRMRDDQQEKEEEIECLQQELRDSDTRHQQYVTQMEHELSLKQHMLETLERQLKDARDRIDNVESGRNSAFEKQLECFEQQRQEYNQKIDKLQVDNLEKDRQLAQISHKYERMSDDLERKRQEMDHVKSSNEKERKQLTEKVESNKRKVAELQDESMKQKLEFGREQALAKQQIEFQNKKIDELSKHLDESQKNFDEKLKHFKADLQDEAQSQIERITSEKELWENKYEQKRRALKEIEMSLSKSNNDLEKKLLQQSQMIERLEEERRQLEDNYQDEISNLQLQIQASDSNHSAAYYYGSLHAEDVQKLTKQIQDLESQLSDMGSAYDRDKALWEGKCQFLETQKETFKRDLQESQKKFELTLEQLQRRGTMDKDKFENSQQALIKVIESKHQTKVKEIMENHNHLLSEAQSKIKKLEHELKLTQEKLTSDYRGKQSDYASLEKRVSDLSENEKRLMSEMDELKGERDRRVQEYQRQVERDRETYRQKLGEYEQKAKDSESKRTQLMFEFEKERAKWQLEKDNLVSKVHDLEELIDKLTLKKDHLLKENERLKAENKGSKKQLLLQNTQNYPHVHQSSVGISQSLQSTGQYGHSSGSTSATRYNMMTNKSLAAVVGTANTLSQAISKMKENNKYIGGTTSLQSDLDSVNIGASTIMGNPSTSSLGSGAQYTTPMTKPYNRYGGQH